MLLIFIAQATAMSLVSPAGRLQQHAIIRHSSLSMSGTGSSSLNPLQRFTTSPAWVAYEQALEAQPVLTKGVTSLIGFALGDVIAQTLIEQAAVIDIARVIKFSSFGFLVHGTTCHFFYNYLDRLVPGTDAKPVATKVLVDQILWNPIFGCMFFSYLTLYDGGSIPQALVRIQQSLATQVTGSWGFWGPAHVINVRALVSIPRPPLGAATPLPLALCCLVSACHASLANPLRSIARHPLTHPPPQFKYVPTEQRLLYINVLQVVYNVFLSVISAPPAPS